MSHTLTLQFQAAPAANFRIVCETLDDPTVKLHRRTGVGAFVAELTRARNVHIEQLIAERWINIQGSIKPSWIIAILAHAVALLPTLDPPLSTETTELDLGMIDCRFDYQGD